MISTIIALLVETGLLTPEEGQEMATRIRQGTLPQDYTSAHRQVETWLKEIRNKK